jgi:hypothetical protein
MLTKWLTLKTKQADGPLLSSCRNLVKCGVLIKEVESRFWTKNTGCKPFVKHYHDIRMQLITLLEVDEKDSWFQHGPTHTAWTSMALLREFFGYRLISQWLWSPISPTFLCHNYFYGVISKHVYTIIPTAYRKRNQTSKMKFPISIMTLLFGWHPTWRNEWVHAFGRGAACYKMYCNCWYNTV